MFWELNDIPHLWRACIPPTLVHRLVLWDNPQGDRNMGEFELVASVLHIAFLAPHVTSLLHAQNGCDIINATGWNTCQSTILLAISDALLCQCDFLFCD